MFIVYVELCLAAAASIGAIGWSLVHRLHYCVGIHQKVSVGLT